MGEILQARYAEEMYSIGMFGGAGVYANNSGKEEKITPPDSTNLDIKHIINALSGFVSYINVPERMLKGSEWLRQNIIVNDTFIDLSGSNKMILSKHFDGLLFIDSVSPPEK